MSRTKRLAFSSESRLTEKSGFNRVFTKTVYAKRSGLFSVFAARGEQPQARLGIVVAKRNVKLAVSRNKLKRLIRESFRLQQEALCGLDIVVIVKKDFALLDMRCRAAIFDGVGDKHSKCYKG